MVKLKSIKVKLQLYLVGLVLVLLAASIFLFQFVSESHIDHMVGQFHSLVQQDDISGQITHSKNETLASMRNYGIVGSVLLMVLAVGCINLIVHRLTQPVESFEDDLQHRLNDRTDALDAVTEKLDDALTELHITQKQIIQTETQKSLTSIVSGFGHEINNPLTGILGYIDLIQLNDDLSTKSRKRLERIKDQSIRIKEIIDDLNMLDPEIEQVKSDINLCNLLEKLIKIIRKNIKTSDIMFLLDCEDQLLVRGNHFALWQVFEGIIENSVEALTSRHIQDGQITLKVVTNDDRNQVITRIIDNAGGFDSIEKAFNPFYTTKCRTQKKGIGLAIAFNLIQEHKGTILIENNKLGAMVSVSLPGLTLETNPVPRLEHKTNSTIHHKNTLSGG